MMTMKNIVLALFSITLFISCQDDRPDFSAQIEGLPDLTNVYISKLGKNNQPVPLDTIQIKQGSFQLNIEDGEPQQINMIQIDGVQSNIFFVNEDEPMDAVLYKDSLRSSRITGGEHNELLMTYMDTLKSKSKKMYTLSNEMRQAMMEQDREGLSTLRSKQKTYEEEDIQFRKEIASSNPNSIVAALSLSDLMNSKKLPNTEVKEIYENFSDEVKDHTLGKLIKENISRMSKTDIGAKAESFKAPTPEGDVLALEDAMGKLTLIDFWASWCKPCRMENPNVVRVYNEFKDSGFSIISVSLDKNERGWKKAIADDNMGWYHVSNLQYWSDPIAKDWGIRSIPATFLIDENGIIIAKNLRGNALRQKVSEYLEKI
jgi:thiol-disulfide isomerase/thioredoxin